MKQHKRVNWTGLMIVAAASACSALAFAADDPPTPTNAYEMSIVVDRAEGVAVRNGDYRRAILRIPEHSRDFADNTNLCVAHTMVGQFQHAHRYCEQAVLTAERNLEFGRRPDHDYELELATAYSNRGVLHARMGDLVGAREDFRLAIELDSESGAPEHNRNWFEVDRMEALARRTE